MFNNKNTITKYITKESKNSLILGRGAYSRVIWVSTIDNSNKFAIKIVFLTRSINRKSLKVHFYEK